MVALWIDPATGNVLARAPVTSADVTLHAPPFRIDCAILVADQQDEQAMIRRRAAASGIRTAKIGCHTLRATGIMAYMKNGGRLEAAQQLANHESPRRAKPYDRTGDETSLAEVERIPI
jgi:integrase